MPAVIGMSRHILLKFGRFGKGRSRNARVVEWVYMILLSFTIHRGKSGVGVVWPVCLLFVKRGGRLEVF